MVAAAAGTALSAEQWTGWRGAARTGVSTARGAGEPGRQGQRRLGSAGRHRPRLADRRRPARLRVRPARRAGSRAGDRSRHRQVAVERGLRRAVHHELGRDGPRQGAEVDAGPGRRPALHARHHGRALGASTPPPARCSGAMPSTRSSGRRPTSARRCRRIVDSGLLIAHVGGIRGGALRAFDPATGATKWSWPGDGPGYASPIAFVAGGVRQIVTETQKKVVAVDAANGHAALVAAARDALRAELGHARCRRRPRDPVSGLDQADLRGAADPRRRGRVDAGEGLGAQGIRRAT